jgi:hypothetical protein
MMIEKFRVNTDSRIDIYLEERDNGVMLCAREERGSEWALVFIPDDGPIKLMAHIPVHLGFELDENGALVTRGELDD